VAPEEEQVAVIMVSVAVVVGSILLWGTAEKRPPG
jgi:hypothetical protein